MKLGFILFVIGAILTLYLTNVKFEKKLLSRFGIIIGVLLTLYGLILIVQPNEKEYVKFTKTTISKTIVDTNNTK